MQWEWANANKTQLNHNENPLKKSPKSGWLTDSLSPKSDWFRKRRILWWFVGIKMMIWYKKYNKMEIMVISSLNHNQMLQFLLNFRTEKSFWGYFISCLEQKKFAVFE